MTYNALDGFEYYKTCTCGGILQHRFRRVGNWNNKYYIFPKKNQVRLFKDNRGVGIIAYDKLQDKISEYGI